MCESPDDSGRTVKLSIVIPCYNEERTLKLCVERVLAIADEKLSLELIIVDDHSEDNSYTVAEELHKTYAEIHIIRHDKNTGKGSALRTGFKAASGDYVAVQDADLEYDPNDLKNLLVPLLSGEADVVLGSRFLSSGAHRVLYYWHSLGNRFLTFLSNMFTDLNLTDMECCYKVFSREVIQHVNIQEDRFGFEPEIISKIAQMRLRIFEMGVSYYGRTYDEGKKITVKDGFRALYCIFRYNAHIAPLPMQLLIYLVIGTISAISNFCIFYLLYSLSGSIDIAVPSAFFLAACLNYILCISILFKRGVRWTTRIEPIIYLVLIVLVGAADLGLTKFFLAKGFLPSEAKLIATSSIFFMNFFGRRFLVFPEAAPRPWRPQIEPKM
ncbi:MAG: glycosyl transferase [Desulfatitalea sp. BRH_c12]|nr:MAG: glycosyl transferase [Desulfatitalea sp. BRH_c12]